ncbi:MAG: DUF2163 domain-containing protein [Henriciella sp.]
MKVISEELSAALAGEALTLCLCWRLTRSDGFVLGLCDHDRALEVDGVTYMPGATLEAGRFSQSADLKPGRGAAAGALSADAITEEDLLAGLWTRCRIDLLRVDWSQQGLGSIPVWSGFLSEITRNSQGSFEAELVSLKADLERPVGRILQKHCDAVLGDERCGFPANGETCDQSFSTCRDVFQNTDNFRGFPHMPGTDFVLSGPAASGNDGSKL